MMAFGGLLPAMEFAEYATVTSPSWTRALDGWGDVQDRMIDSVKAPLLGVSVVK